MPNRVQNAKTEKVVTPSKIHILRSLKDWIEVCKNTKTDYRVIGSVAMVGALGKFHRIPGDLDVLYDKRNEERINRALEDKRYKSVSAGNPQNLFPKDLPRYIKGSQIIEPRKADFSGEEIFITLKAPIPLMPAPLRPTVRLKFGKEMSKSITYRINGVVFKSLSKEALWVGLNTIRIFKRKDDMRLNLKIGDQELLTPTINKRRIDSIYLDKPGVYWNNIPLVTAC